MRRIMHRLALWASLLAPLGALAQDEAPSPKDRPGDVMPDRHWDFLHLDLDVKVDPAERRVQGTATHTVAPLGQLTSHLRVHQVGLDIEEVRIDGEIAERWRVGTETLDIPMPPKDGERTVAIRFSARPEIGLHFRHPSRGADRIVEVWSQGEDEDHRYWYPGWDYRNDRFTVTTHLTVPASLHAVAVGDLLGSEPAEPGWTRWSYALEEEIPNYLVAVAAGEYTVYTEQGAVPLEYIVPRGVTEDEARAALSVAEEQLRWFTERLDEPFPYPLYRQVVVQRFLYGGMENPTLTVIGEKYFHTTDGVRGRPTENVVAHELVHQWFGDLVTCYGWREMWLNEGFATYWAARWQEDRHGEEFAAVKIRERQRAAKGVKVPMAARSWSRVGEQENGGNYTRGASVLQMLRVLLGEGVLDQATYTYIEEHRGRFVESEDLRRTLEDASGTHLGWLFDQYVYTGGHPTLASSWEWADGVLTITIEQTTEGTPYTVPVDIEIGSGRTRTQRRVWVEDGETQLHMDLEEPPLWVAMDPKGMLIADWAHEQPTEAWVAQLQISASPFARHDAVEALAKGDATDEVVEALSNKLEDPAVDPDFRYRVAAALGALSSPEAVKSLVVATFDTSPRVREGAVDALGRVQSTTESLERLVVVHEGDDDPVVRASALAALDSIDPKRSLRLARRRIAIPDRSHRSVEHNVAITVLEKRGNASDLRRLLDKLEPIGRSYTRLDAAYSAGPLFQTLEADDQEKLRDRATALGELLLTDDDFRIRTAGIQLLGEIGGSDAERSLEAYGSATTVSWHRERARAAAARIRSRRGGEIDGPHQGADSDLKALETEVEELRERVERLEEWQ